MLSEAIRLLSDELGGYFKLDPNPPYSGTLVLMDNIADLENRRAALENHVVVTLVNAEEESSLKNARPVIKNGMDGALAFREPAVHLNLYLLFCAPHNQDPDAYETALGRISRAVKFFQSKRLFTIQNSPHSSLGGSHLIDEEEKAALRLVVEMYTLTFEQINHLWGSLGGKQVPFVMYKARLVSIQDRIDKDVPVIEEIRKDDRVIQTPT